MAAGAAPASKSETTFRAWQKVRDKEKDKKANRCGEPGSHAHLYRYRGADCGARLGVDQAVIVAAIPDRRFWLNRSCSFAMTGKILIGQNQAALL